MQNKIQIYLLWVSIPVIVMVNPDDIIIRVGISHLPYPLTNCLAFPVSRWERKGDNPLPRPSLICCWSTQTGRKHAFLITEVPCKMFFNCFTFGQRIFQWNDLSFYHNHTQCFQISYCLSLWAAPTSRKGRQNRRYKWLPMSSNLLSGAPWNCA